MNFLQMQEKVLQHFPEVGLTQIKIDLNKKYREYCHETELIKDDYNETIVADTVSYTLAADVDKIYKIKFYDSDTKEIEDAAYNLKHRIDNGVIKFYDFNFDVITEIDSYISQITYFYVKIPTALSSDTDTPVIDSIFHDAPVAAVLKEYYATFPSRERRFQDGSIVKEKDPNMAVYWGNEYREYIIKGKKTANTNKDNTGFNIKGGHF